MIMYNTHLGVHNGNTSSIALASLLGLSVTSDSSGGASKLRSCEHGAHKGPSGDHFIKPLLHYVAQVSHQRWQYRLMNGTFSCVPTVITAVSHAHFLLP